MDEFEVRRDPVHWQEDGRSHSARWLSATGHRPPRRLEVVDADLRPHRAMELASNGVGMLWRGEFGAARRLLDTMRGRLDRHAVAEDSDPAAMFYRYRQFRRNRARILGMVLVELGRDPISSELTHACQRVYGSASDGALVSAQELQGVLSAERWRQRGILIPALGDRIHPHYGVFTPTRQEYVDLLADAELPAAGQAFDIGTGTGVLAVLLARRGVGHVVATDVHRRAVDCARDNVRRLGLEDRVRVLHTDLFPPGRADLVLCNPPWLPVAPTSTLDAAVFDHRSRMLTGFLRAAPNHLHAGGQVWLVLSDLAERLGLRTRQQLLDEFEAAGLRVLGTTQTPPRHPRAGDRREPLARFRAAERVTLWRLGTEA